MQRERSSLDSFPEPIDLNQGSFPNNTSMDNSPSEDNMLDPVLNQMSNYILASNDGNASWDRGEPSSTPNNHQDGDVPKTSLGWSSSRNVSPGSDNWSFEPSDTNTSYVSNHRTGGSLSMQNYRSNRGSLNLSSNHGHVREQVPTFYTPSNNIGTSSNSSACFLEDNDLPGPSFGTWGSSCKRKALEGSPGQFYPGGSSSSNPSMGKNIIQEPIPGNLTISSSSAPLNLSPTTNRSEQPNPSSGVGMSRAAASGFFPSSSVPRIAESPDRNLNSPVRSISGRPFAYNLPASSRDTSLRNFSVYAQSRPIPNTDSSSDLSNTLNHQPHLTHVNEPRGTHTYPWSGSLGSRGGNSAYIISGERERERGSSRRNNLEAYPMTVSAPPPEPRDLSLQDQIDWSFAPEASASARNRSSGSRAGSGSGGRASSSSNNNAAWLPHQRLSEAAPWIPFPRIESDAALRRTQFALFPSSSSSSDEVASTSRAQHQLDQRSAALLMDMTSDDVNGRRALAAVEGRHRLIRQVLNAMRRGVHLQAEDYMMIDPFINGFAELHDRHRDMRLDVDNMSYEELLALEERIGDVSTGLTEEKIKGSMKQRKYEATRALPNMEPCCVCQEAYISGDDMGMLDCGHEFHASCIKQWLNVKNICPICKMTALDDT